VAARPANATLLQLVQPTTVAFAIRFR
jgi:hypothetical protein